MTLSFKEFCTQKMQKAVGKDAWDDEKTELHIINSLSNKSIYQKMYMTYLLDLNADYLSACYKNEIDSSKVNKKKQLRMIN